MVLKFFFAKTYAFLRNAFPAKVMHFTHISNFIIEAGTVKKPNKEDVEAKKRRRHKFVEALKSHPSDFYNEQKTQAEAFF